VPQVEYSLEKNAKILSLCTVSDATNTSRNSNLLSKVRALSYLPLKKDKFGCIQAFEKKKERKKKKAFIIKRQFWKIHQLQSSFFSDLNFNERYPSKHSY